MRLIREEAQRFRARARECRMVRDRTRDEVARRQLLQLAQELEGEARTIEGERPELR